MAKSWLPLQWRADAALLADAVVVLHFGYVLFAVAVKSWSWRAGCCAGAGRATCPCVWPTWPPWCWWPWKPCSVWSARSPNWNSGCASWRPAGGASAVFRGRLVRSVIFYDFPAWIFTLAYVGFAVLVAGSFLLFPPGASGG